MALQADIIVDTTEVQEAVKLLGERAGPRALSDTLTSLAFDARRDIQAEMQSVLDKPISFTTRGVFVKKATFKEEPITAEVGLQRIQSDYLADLVTGGSRDKGDRGVTRAGVLTPTPSAKLNAAGNFPEGPLRWLANINKTTNFRRFAGTAGESQTFGIWQRSKEGGLALLAFFRPSVSYEKKLDVVAIVEKTVDDKLVATFNRFFQKEMGR